MGLWVGDLVWVGSYGLGLGWMAIAVVCVGGLRGWLFVGRFVLGDVAGDLVVRFALILASAGVGCRVFGWCGVVCWLDW